MGISRVLGKTLFMMQAVEPHLQRLLSEIHTDTSKELSISSLSKECTLASLSTPDPRHRSPLEIFFQSTHFQKELSFPTSRPKWVTEVPSPEPPELQPLSSAIPMIRPRLRSDSHPALERTSREPAEV